ncbi:MAG: hypothetical protein QXO16_02980 [Archaeoglobaceae archaeon]
MRGFSSTHSWLICQRSERNDWEEYRRRRLEDFEKEKREGRVDEDIVPLLEWINSIESYVTLSSCSGRIAVLDLEDFGKKLNSRFLGKWHRSASFEEVLESARNCKRQGWLIQFPPIVHVACKDLASAEKLLRVANMAGFRRSGVISLRNLVVEIASLERIEIPIAIDGKLIVDESYLRTAVEIANLKLEKGKRKLEKLFNLLSEIKNEK